MKEKAKKLITDIQELNRLLEEVRHVTREKIMATLAVAIELHQHLQKTAQTFDPPEPGTRIPQVLPILRDIILSCQSQDIMMQRLAHVLQVHEMLSDMLEAHCLSTKHPIWFSLSGLVELQLLHVQDVRRTYWRDVKYLVSQWNKLSRYGIPSKTWKQAWSAIGLNDAEFRVRNIKTEDYFMASHWIHIEMSMYNLKNFAGMFDIKIHHRKMMSVYQQIEQLYTMHCERSLSLIHI